MVPYYGIFFKSKTSYAFWLDVFTSWTKLTKSQKIKLNLQIASTPIRYNTNLTVEIMFFPKCYSKGIITISDVLDKEKKILTHQVIKDHYNFDSFNFLDYIHLSTVVSKFMKRHKNRIQKNNRPNYAHKLLDVKRKQHKELI